MSYEDLALSLRKQGVYIDLTSDNQMLILSYPSKEDPTVYKNSELRTNIHSSREGCFVKPDHFCATLRMFGVVITQNPNLINFKIDNKVYGISPHYNGFIIIKLVPSEFDLHDMLLQQDTEKLGLMKKPDVYTFTKYKKRMVTRVCVVLGLTWMVTTVLHTFILSIAMFAAVTFISLGLLLYIAEWLIEDAGDDL